MEARATTGSDAAKTLADVARYREEEKQLQAQATGFEQARDEAAKHGAPLGFAIASLQISIALASVCLITKRRLLWGVSGLLGIVGLSYLLVGLYGI